MGLDFRLSHKGESIMEGNGRNAFAFVREWVESKGKEYYGENILLTKEDLNSLMKAAIKQYVGDDNKYKTLEDFKDGIIKSDNIDSFNVEPLMQKLLIIYALQDFDNYYLECDW